MRAIWLVGMMGSGKTTVGELVARGLGLAFIDTDSMIEAETHRSIAAIWEIESEDAFRDLESELLARLVTSGQDAVIATGGGAVLRPENIAAMRNNGMVVWLVADPSELAARIHQSESRPLIQGGQQEERLAELLAGRADSYAEAAHYIVETGSRGREEIAREVMTLWHES